MAYDAEQIAQMERRYTDAAHKSLIPEHCVSGLVHYIVHGIPPGSFLGAILRNDLMDAAGRADHINAASLHRYAGFLYNDAPADAHGSRELVADWIDRGGLVGARVRSEA